MASHRMCRICAAPPCFNSPNVNYGFKLFYSVPTRIAICHVRMEMEILYGCDIRKATKRTALRRENTTFQFFSRPRDCAKHLKSNLLAIFQIIDLD